MVTEVKAILKSPKSIAELNELIESSIASSLKELDADLEREFNIENRTERLKILKKVASNQDILDLPKESFLRYLQENYSISLHESYSANSFVEYVKLTEQNLLKDIEEYETVAQSSREKLLDNITVIADFHELKESLKPESPFAYLKQLVSQFPNLQKRANFSIKFMPDHLEINDKVPEILNKQELLELVDLIKHVRRTKPTPSFDVGIREYFSDTDTSIEQVIRANYFVKSVAADIKSKNLTPFETVVIVHKFCSEFGYTNRGGDERYGSRLLKNVIASGNINCVGFSTMFKSIIDEIGDPNLKVSFNNGILPYNNDYYYGQHGNLLVEIEDQEYGISGAYIDDVSLNNSRESFGNNLSCCLMPVQDLDHIEDFQYYHSNFTLRKDFFNEDLKPTDYNETTIDVDKLMDEHYTFIKKYNSPAIPVVKYGDALKSIGIKSGMSLDDAEEFADYYIDRSLSASINVFSHGATNSFYELATEIGLEDELIISFENSSTKENERKRTGAKNKRKIESIIGPTF